MLECSLHRTLRFGSKLKSVVETAREQVAESIGAHPLDMIFTSFATESNNAAIAAALRGTDKPTTSSGQALPVKGQSQTRAGEGVKKSRAEQKHLTRRRKDAEAQRDQRIYSWRPLRLGVFARDC
ncbi:MAG: aminotransferase class V-fold PLP-dependent enzyme [Terriglobia bacterium]